MQVPNTFEYIWLDSNNKFRSKTIVAEMVDGKPLVQGCDINGSYTGQAVLEGDSEVFLTPCYEGGIVQSPFNFNSHLVLCTPTDKDENPLGNAKNRKNAKNIFQKYKDKETWFGIEQEYCIVNPRDGKSIGNVTENHYCGVGYDNVFGREIERTFSSHD